MKRLTKKQMIIFAVGQLGWSTLSGIINAMLVTFYLPSSENIEAGAIQFIKPGLIVFGVLTLLASLCVVCCLFTLRRSLRDTMKKSIVENIREL